MCEDKVFSVILECPTGPGETSNRIIIYLIQKNVPSIKDVESFIEDNNDIFKDIVFHISEIMETTMSVQDVDDIKSGVTYDKH